MIRSPACNPIATELLIHPCELDSIMNGGNVIERGTLPDGTTYRVWERYHDGKRYVYAGDGDAERRHSMRWLRDRKAGGKKEGWT